MLWLVFKINCTLSFKTLYYTWAYMTHTFIIPGHILHKLHVTYYSQVKKWFSSLMGTLSLFFIWPDLVIICIFALPYKELFSWMPFLSISKSNPEICNKIYSSPTSFTTDPLISVAHGIHLMKIIHIRTHCSAKYLPLSMKGGFSIQGCMTYLNQWNVNGSNIYYWFWGWLQFCEYTKNSEWYTLGEWIL